MQLLVNAGEVYLILSLSWTGCALLPVSSPVHLPSHHEVTRFRCHSDSEDEYVIIGKTLKSYLQKQIYCSVESIPLFGNSLDLVDVIVGEIT